MLECIDTKEQMAREAREQQQQQQHQQQQQQQQQQQGALVGFYRISVGFLVVQFFFCINAF